MAKKKISTKDSQQPRAITPETLAIQPYFRGSMYAELQKFKDKGKTRQLMLGEDDSQDVEIEAFGLDLSVSEDRALHAIQVLLDRTDYQGNIPGQQIVSSSYKFQGLLPRLAITYSDYFAAYGLDRRDGQYYKGHQAAEALAALRSLAQSRRIAYKRRRWAGRGASKRARYDIIRVTKPLLSFIEGFQDLDEEEAAKVLDGQDLPEKRQTRLIIEVSPLLVDDIETFYLLKPTALHTEIKDLLGSKRISRAVSLFIEWLLTKNTQAVRISKETLAERLRLDYLIEHRHWSRLDKILQEAFQAAKDLEYLLDFSEEPSGLLLFTLNPERCQRVVLDSGDGVSEEEEL